MQRLWVVSKELCTSLLPNVSEPWHSNLIYWFVNSNYNVSHSVVKIANYTTVVGRFTAKWGCRGGDRGVEGGEGRGRRILAPQPYPQPFCSFSRKRDSID